MRSPSEIRFAEEATVRCRQVARGASLFASAIGLAVLGGWLLHIGLLMTVLPGSVTMKPNTATAFCLAGASLFLFLWAPEKPNRWAKPLSAALAVVVILAALLTLSEYAAGFNFGLDEFLFRDRIASSATGYAPGRMAPITAFNFVCLGLALTLLPFPKRAPWVQALAGGAAFTSLLALIGYFYGVSSLYQSGHTTAVALHTAVTCLTLCAGLCCATQNYGFMRLVKASGMSGMLMRRFGLAVLVLPFAFGELRLAGQSSGWYGLEMGQAIFAMVYFVTFAALLWVGANSVHAAERRSAAMQESLRQAQQALEQRVQQRTVDLAAANEHLQNQIADRINAERANQQIFDNSLDVICTFDIEGRFLQVSRACEAVWGYQPEELIGRPYIDLVHPDDRGKTVAVDAAIVDGTPCSNFENRYVRRDGSVVHMLWTARWSEAHQANYCVARDLTERRRMEEKMRLLESAVEQAEDSVLIAEDDGLSGPRIVFVNAAYTKMTGYTAEESIGQHPQRLKGPRTDQTVLRQLRQELESGGTFAGEIVYYRKDGTEFVMELRIAPIRDVRGQTRHFVSIQRDITERRRAEGELLAAKAGAEAANRAKSEFLANMSHEIRTPMNGIMGMTDLVLETSLDHEQREYLEMVKFSADALLLLINDILDFSKIEAGKLDLETISFSLRDTIGGMLKALGIRADQRGLELTADIPAHVPDHLVGDPARLRQILINLLSNAIKFTHHGDVMLRVDVESEADGEQLLRFSVSDTGIGIPLEKQALIFEAFAQADGSTTRTYGGSGLGLAIASPLVRQMGGRIWVESTVGEGTTFHFTARFPVRHTPAPDIRRADPGQLAGLRVLVVDDNAVNRRILCEMLTHWRMQPSIVSSGALAVEHLLAAARAGEPFPLVILDGMMPEMDGFEVAEIIRERAELAGATVMMLSSALPAGAPARCAELGVAKYLMKPVEQSALLEAILVAIERAPKSEPAAQATPLRQVERGLRILLAEDNVINRTLVASILEKRGHSLVHASNGREAVAAAAGKPFDLIFMDVQMPEMDGYEATRLIREFEAGSGRQTVIAAMTARAMAGDRERCFAAGMDDYLSKPLQRDDLLDLLERVATAAGSGADGYLPAAPLNGQRQPGASQMLPRESPEPVPPMFTRAVLLDQLDGDEATLEILINLFQENTPGLLDDIRASIARRDVGDIAYCAHALLGSLGALGADRARRLTQELETQADEQDYEQIDRTFASLERETGDVHLALAAFIRPGT